jgi:hypothetical protein
VPCNRRHRSVRNRGEAGWPEREPNQRFQLQTVSGEALPILKEAFLTLTLGRRPLKSWVFVADITNEFILGLDILRAYDSSVDLGRQTLRLAEEEVSLWTPGVGPRLSNLVMAKDHVLPAQCAGLCFQPLVCVRFRRACVLILPAVFARFVH